METNAQVISEPKEGLFWVGAQPVIVKCPEKYHGSDMGYSKSAWSIQAIYDQNGVLLEPVFELSWTEIAPGIATCDPHFNERWSSGQHVCEQAVRISAEACPVKVVFKYVYEYNDYDGLEGSSNTETVTMLFQVDR